MAACYYIFSFLQIGHSADWIVLLFLCWLNNFPLGPVVPLWSLGSISCLSSMFSSQYQDQNQIWSVAHSITHCGLGGCQQFTFLPLCTNPDNVLMLPALLWENVNINQSDMPKELCILSLRVGRVVSAATVKRNQHLGLSSCQKKELKSVCIYLHNSDISLCLATVRKHCVIPFFFCFQTDWT